MSSLIQNLIFIPFDNMRVFSYPKFPEDTPYMLDLIPKLALSDAGNHPVYFILPSSKPAPRLFGISFSYVTHAMVLLTSSLSLNSLTQLLSALYPLFTQPTPDTLQSLFESVQLSPLESLPIVPPVGLFNSITKILKLMLLPFKTIIYSPCASDVSLSLLFLLQSIPGIFSTTYTDSMKALSFPLQIGTSTHPIIPHLPATLIDRTTSPIFSELTKDWDVVVNIENNKIKHQPEIGRLLEDSREDKLLILKFKTYYARKLYTECMQLISWYLQGLLNTIAPLTKRMTSVSWDDITKTPASEYGVNFLKAWLSAPSFTEWKERVVVDTALKFDVKHPGRTDSEHGSYASETVAAYFTTNWMINVAIKADTYFNRIKEEEEEEEQPHQEVKTKETNEQKATEKEIKETE
ncbi:UDENN domain-containing protein [Entamoeba marina]